MTLGARLKQARNLTKVAAADLGTWAGLSRGTVGMIENGSRPDPSGTTVAKLATALGTTTDWLLTGEGDGPTREQVTEATEQAKATWEAAEEAKRKAAAGGSEPGDAA